MFTGAAIHSVLVEAARTLYGATDGEIVLESFRVHSNSGCCSTCCDGGRCNICFKSSSFTGGTAASLCGRMASGEVRFTWDDLMQYSSAPWIPAKVLMHEFGHQFFCADDEYHTGPGGTSPYECGHSVMALGLERINNMCSASDHGLDLQESDPGAPATSARQQAYDVGASHSNHNQTMDGYSYRDHDLNGRISATILPN